MERYETTDPIVNAVAVLLGCKPGTGLAMQMTDLRAAGRFDAGDPVGRILAVVLGDLVAQQGVTNHPRAPSWALDDREHATAYESAETAGMWARRLDQTDPQGRRFEVQHVRGQYRIMVRGDDREVEGWVLVDD